MSILARSWLIMSGLAVCVALLLAVAPTLPRPIWLAVVLGSAALKSRLILLDYLELRGAAVWRSGAMGAVIVLITALAVLSAF